MSDENAERAFQLLKHAIRGPSVSATAATTRRQSTLRRRLPQCERRRASWVAGQVVICQRGTSFRAYERYVAGTKRKSLPIIDKMARTAQACIKAGSAYRPFFEGLILGGRTSLGRWRLRDLEDGKGLSVACSGPRVCYGRELLPRRRKPLRS
jgi:hypothetical protein